MSPYVFAIPVAVLALTVQVLDVYSTDEVIERGGRELNPWMAKLQAWLGDHWGFPKYFLGILLAGLALWQPIPVVLAPILTLSVVNGWIVVRNFKVLRRQKERE